MKKIIDEFALLLLRAFFLILICLLFCVHVCMFVCVLLSFIKHFRTVSLTQNSII